MEIIINNETRYFNDTRVRLWKKAFSIIKIWFVVFPIAYIFYLIKFVDDLEDITIFIPFFHYFVAFIILVILQLFIPNGNKKYISTYYPEIAKKLYPFGGSGYNTIQLLRFIDYEYIEEGVDDIIDEITEFYSRLIFTIKMVFFGGIILSIFGLIIVGIKI